MKHSRIERNKQKKFSARWIVAVVLMIAVAAIVYVTVFNDRSEPVTPTNAEPVQQTPAPAEQTPEPAQPNEEQPVENAPAPVEIDEAGYGITKEPVTEPTYINGVLIANKKYPLPKDYAPGEDETALNAYKQMEAAAKKAGFTITAFSGFRSYEYQETLYNKYVTKDGQANADRYSARPGHSEHQTGLAFDIGEVGREELWLTAAFGETPAGQWLVNNAHKFGFILRYPQGKEEITGFMYESWHFRYLGPELATEVKKAGVTLEEFLNID